VLLYQAKEYEFCGVLWADTLTAPAIGEDVWVLVEDDFVVSICPDRDCRVLELTDEV